MSLKQCHRLRCYLGGQVRSITSTVHGSDVRPFAEIPGPKGLPYLGTLFNYTIASANTCFETRLGALTSFDKNDFPQKMVDANQRMLTHSLRLRFSIPFWRYIATPTWKSLVQSEDFFFGNAQRLVNETCAEIKRLVEKNELTEGRYGFMSYLLGKNMSYEETSPTTIGQLYCLATNPEAQDKLHREIKRVLGEKNQLVTAEHLTKLQYLKNCIKEGFRFFPIGTEVSRIAQQNIVIGGYEIPEGTHVEMNNNMLLRSEEYIEEPEVYDPDRWGGADRRQTFIPICSFRSVLGPECVQEMWVFVAKLVQNFRLEWNEAHTMEQDYRILLTPNCPANISFIPREL
ncbi:hypothetical protein CAPTEDRAFT_222264 [Capitella teleta]|uniref:Cytochrome P450 n=1 Tax=Capitella teleta TaxID=283909 RepID=R7VHW3_CAPTE|nr:hypothetical protein CAPTEDRAFT_222264 [Capitella teleta]|eukprot:ELU15896.1 hypothetical protein CAPTEDRAFT_222264 [Capitella teleta]